LCVAFGVLAGDISANERHSSSIAITTRTTTYATSRRGACVRDDAARPGVARKRTPMITNATATSTNTAAAIGTYSENRCSYGARVSALAVSIGFDHARVGAWVQTSDSRSPVRLCRRDGRHVPGRTPGHAEASKRDDEQTRNTPWAARAIADRDQQTSR
jgi:hypothetical protein